MSPFLQTVSPAVTSRRDRRPARYSSVGASRSLFYSTDLRTLVELHPEVDGLRQLSDETRLVVSEPLGASPELSALVLERYDEAIAGDIRMNCDVCLYRVQLPGHAAAVGAAQVPHSHPDDPE